MKKKFFVVFLFLATLFLIGCTQKIQEKATEKMVEDMTGGKVNLDLGGEKTQVETEFGTTQIGENLKLPTDFPKDIYVIDGLIKSSYKNVGKNGWTISIETSKSIKEAGDLYDKNLTITGWKKDNFMDLGGAATASYSKDNRTISLMINVDPINHDKTLVMLGTSEN